MCAFHRTRCSTQKKFCFCSINLPLNHQEIDHHHHHNYHLYHAYDWPSKYFLWSIPAYINKEIICSVVNRNFLRAWWLKISVIFLIKIVLTWSRTISSNISSFIIPLPIPSSLAIRSTSRIAHHWLFHHSIHLALSFLAPSLSFLAVIIIITGRNHIRLWYSSLVADFWVAVIAIYRICIWPPFLEIQYEQKQVARN